MLYFLLYSCYVDVLLTGCEFISFAKKKTLTCEAIKMAVYNRLKRNILSEGIVKEINDAVKLTDPFLNYSEILNVYTLNVITF